MRQPAPPDRQSDRDTGGPRPPVSVVVPHYNQQQFIARCLASIGPELGPDDEVIIVDDASPAGFSLDVQWQALLPCPLSLEVQPVNKGPGAARNLGANRARHDYAAFLDADDRCLPGRLAAQTAAMRRGEDILACVGDFLIERRSNTEPALSRHEAGEEAVRDQLRSGYMFAAGSTLMVRRKNFIALGGYDETMRVYEDWDLMLRLLQHGRIVHCGIVIARISASGSTPNRARRLHCLETIASRHLPGLDKPARRALWQAICYERASLEYRDRKSGRAVAWLVRAAVANPRLLLRRLVGRIVRRRT
jgi:glycosyltransferase involved in cell wall biosynthesis